MTHHASHTSGTGYPVQLDLPGQTHVADGPHDQSGMYVMHHGFRRDLARFERAVRNTPVGDAATWRALAKRWAAFTEVLHHHHTIEDDECANRDLTMPLRLHAERQRAAHEVCVGLFG